MKDKTDVPEKPKGAHPVSRQYAYQRAAAHFQTALDTIIWLMANAKQESVRASAANKIIDKVLPDLKASEHSFDDIQKLTIKIVRDSHKDGDV